MSQVAFWLHLLRIEGMGARRIRVLMEHFQTPQKALEADAQEWIAIGIPPAATALRNQVSEEQIASDCAWANKPNRTCLTIHCDDYPPLLRELPDAPPVLFVHGNVKHLSRPQVAIVGSRRPSVDGREYALLFAQDIAKAGFAVTSGLALGIDALAHEGALNAKGITIAVLGNGPGVNIYPKDNRILAQRIVDSGGAIVSEFLPGTPPAKENFPRRNRIICGLAQGTLVVEATQQSGSLITANQALQYNREVFAIPGSIRNEQSKGCHSLIKQGHAMLVENADDILDNLRYFSSNHRQPAAPKAPSTIHIRGKAKTAKSTARTEQQALPLQQDATVLLSFLGDAPISIDALVERSGLTAEEISRNLIILELQGCVISVPGGRYQRVQKN